MITEDSHKRNWSRRGPADCPVGVEHEGNLTCNREGGLRLQLRESKCHGTPRQVSCRRWPDRKSTRLNSSHLVISYAVFCLKKKTELSSCSSIVGIGPCIAISKHLNVAA